MVNRITARIPSRIMARMMNRIMARIPSRITARMVNRITVLMLNRPMRPIQSRRTDWVRNKMDCQRACSSLVCVKNIKG